MSVADHRRYAFVYLYWNNQEQKTFIEEDYKVPILISIATLRAWVDSPVYVIDTGSNEVNWGEWPSTLDFSVVKKPAVIKETIQVPGLNFYHRLLSKPADVYASLTYIDEPFVYFADGDIFFLSSPLPTGNPIEDNFCCNTSNTGIYYFDRTASDCIKVMETWASGCCYASLCEQYAQEVCETLACDWVHDESVFQFLLRRHEREYPLALGENVKLGAIHGREISSKMVKSLHFASCHVKNKLERVKSAMEFREIRHLAAKGFANRFPTSWEWLMVTPVTRSLHSNATFSDMMFSRASD